MFEITTVRIDRLEASMVVLVMASFDTMNGQIRQNPRYGANELWFGQAGF